MSWLDGSYMVKRGVAAGKPGAKHQLSELEQEVTIPGIGSVPFSRGESIRTEISCKYDRQSVAELFEPAGLRIETWRPDPGSLFALVVGAPS